MKRMNVLKKGLCACLAAVMLLGLTACGGNDASTDTPEEEAAVEETPVEEVPADPGVTMRVAAMTGPTGMGLVKLMLQAGTSMGTEVTEPVSVSLLEENGTKQDQYSFTLAGTADEISPLMIKGELDAACVPANLASVLYNKTGGEIVTLGINTLGVIYVVDKGDSVQSLADLKGKTVVSAGKGSVPEYAFRYVLTQNGIDPDKDLTIEWKSEQAECVAALASGAAEIAVMPQPYVTVAQGKVEGLRVALSLTEEWEKLDNGSAMLTGVVVARKSFIEEHPAAIEAFMSDYAASVEWVNTNTADAAALIGNYGIVAAAVAEKALPYCNIVCITGTQMQEMLSGYLAALAEQAPQAVGGAVPADDFYFVG